MRLSNCRIACFGKILEKVESYVETGDNSTSIFFSTDNHFHRSPDFRIFMVSLQKKYKIEYDKRVICSDFSTTPYGYQIAPKRTQLGGEADYPAKVQKMS